jgi:hypothetical protein
MYNSKIWFALKVSTPVLDPGFEPWWCHPKLVDCSLVSQRSPQWPSTVSIPLAVFVIQSPDIPFFCWKLIKTVQQIPWRSQIIGSSRCGSPRRHPKGIEAREMCFQRLIQRLLDLEGLEAANISVFHFRVCWWGIWYDAIIPYDMYCSLIFMDAGKLSFSDCFNQVFTWVSSTFLQTQLSKSMAETLNSNLVSFGVQHTWSSMWRLGYCHISL